MNQNPKIGIEVGAEVDRSVGRTFDRTEKHIRGVSKEQKRFDRSVGNTTREVGKQRRQLMGAAKGVRDYGRAVEDAEQSNSVFSRSMTKVGEGLDGALNRWTAFAGGVAGTMMAANVLTMSERFTRLGIQANKTDKEMAALKEQIFSISQLDGVRVDPGQVLAGVEKIVEKTGDLDLATANIRNIALAIQAAGAQGVDIGGMVADIAEKFDVRSAQGIQQMLDMMVKQGKMGAFTLQNLAAEGETVTAAYSRMGRTGPTALQEMGAMLQISRMANGSAAEAATAYESVLEDLVSNQKKVADLGVQLFDPEALANGKEVARSVPQVLKEIIQATKGNVSELSDVFGEEAIKGVSVMAAEYQKTGAFETMDKFLGVKGNGAQLMQDSARAANNAALAYKNLMHVWNSAADDALAGPLQAVADLMTAMDPNTLKTLVQVLGGTALGIGALAVGKKAWDVGKGITDFVRGGRRGGGAPGVGSGGLGGAAGVTPVFVTNMGAGFGAPGKAGRRVGGATKGRGLTRLLGRAGAPAAAVLGAVSLGSTLMDDSLTGDQKITQASGDVGGIGGALAGAAAGAAVGSVVPLVGTAIGGLVGGVLGGFGGEWLGKTVGGWFTGDDAYKTAVKSEAGRRKKSSVSSELNATFHISSTDPETTGREVHRRLRQMKDEEARRGNLAFAD